MLVQVVQVVPFVQVAQPAPAPLLAPLAILVTTCKAAHNALFAPLTVQLVQMAPPVLPALAQLISVQPTVSATQHVQLPTSPTPLTTLALAVSAAAILAPITAPAPSAPVDFSSAIAYAFPHVPPPSLEIPPQGSVRPVEPTATLAPVIQSVLRVPVQTFLILLIIHA